MDLLLKKIHITYKILFAVSGGSWISLTTPFKNFWYRYKISGYFYPFLVVVAVVCQLHHHLSSKILQCCGALLSVMCQPGWEGSLGENGYMYMYD